MSVAAVYYMRSKKVFSSDVLAGKTLREVHDMLIRELGLDAYSIPTVNGVLVDDDHVIEDGETIIFVDRHPRGLLIRH